MEVNLKVSGNFRAGRSKKRNNVAGPVGRTLCQFRHLIDLIIRSGATGKTAHHVS